MLAFLLSFSLFLIHPQILSVWHTYSYMQTLVFKSTQFDLLSFLFGFRVGRSVILQKEKKNKKKEDNERKNVLKLKNVI